MKIYAGLSRCIAQGQNIQKPTENYVCIYRYHDDNNDHKKDDKKKRYRNAH